jgi:hypothetical protein
MLVAQQFGLGDTKREHCQLNNARCSQFESRSPWFREDSLDATTTGRGSRPSSQRANTPRNVPGRIPPIREPRPNTARQTDWQIGIWDEIDTLTVGRSVKPRRFQRPNESAAAWDLELVSPQSATVCRGVADLQTDGPSGLFRQARRNTSPRCGARYAAPPAIRGR